MLIATYYRVVVIIKQMIEEHMEHTADEVQNK